ncbi:hypothetical protein RBA63_13120 [Brenneria goodwinii]|uniref:hypothetical protein n=1 Tax=Brenneria goodwinii TaxID=1109412 RepID=UPI0036EEE65C
MNFNCDNGILELSEKLSLSPYMKKKEILSQNVIWEEWFPKINGVVFNYRTVIDIKDIHGHEKITVIINFNGSSLDSSSLKSWLCAPTHKFTGQQKRPEGKLTKALRTWFNSRTAIILPVSADWGIIDAAYDPHNQTAEIVCHYTQ